MNSFTAAATVALLALPVAGGGRPHPIAAESLRTRTPIKHLVVIYGENVSFDHYFATYPVAQNPPGEPAFRALPHTPSVDGLRGALLDHNPNLDPGNGAGASNPFRLARSQAATADQYHNYGREQLAYDHGAADRFPRYTGRGGPGGTGAFATAGLVMGYFDGNTVTALWNYAQHFAMSDNAHSDQYGPSTPGAIDLISGQTNGLTVVKGSRSSYYVHDGVGGLTLISDVDPAGDACSDTLDAAAMSGRNVGDLLDQHGVSWGWFEGGFDRTVTNADGSTGCLRSTRSGVVESAALDYIPHHEPFQYYRSTANPTHARPSSVSRIGLSGDGANHQYDIRDFFAAVSAGHFPAVSYLKASGFQDGHAGYSDPLDEQTFVAEVINYLERTTEWRSTAVVIMYDDSDGWYDHQFVPAGNASFDPKADQLTGPGACGVKETTPQLGGINGTGPVNGRCGPGPRQPFIVVSPWARINYVDHTLIDQSSVLRFVEDNWLGGARLGGGSFDAVAGSIDGLFDFAGKGNAPTLFLDDTLGTPVASSSGRLPG